MRAYGQEYNNRYQTTIEVVVKLCLEWIPMRPQEKMTNFISSLHNQSTILWSTARTLYYTESVDMIG